MLTSLDTCHLFYPVRLTLVSHYFLSLLIVINIALGAHLLDNGNYEVAGFYIVFIILLTLFQVFLFTIHTINAYKAPESGKQLYHTLHNVLK